MASQQKRGTKQQKGPLTPTCLREVGGCVAKGAQNTRPSVTMYTAKGQLITLVS